MWTSSIFSQLRFALSLLAMFGATFGTVFAASFSVDPISVTLKKTNSSATVAITNQSPQPTRFQITGFGWLQSPSGEMQLTPSNDLVFFPQLVTLAAGETRRVRVGLTAAPGPTEKTYRVFMEELPSLQSITQGAGNVLTLRMKIGIPIFLSPTTPPVISGAVQGAVRHKGTLDFDVVNTGNVHFSVQTVHLIGKSATGATVFTQDVTGWYVLAASTRHYTIPLTKARCTALHSLQINVKADAVTFSNDFANLSGECGSA